MGEKTGILWTHHTFNPWFGCLKVSDGCDHCYAEALVKRFGMSNIWGSPLETERRTFGIKHWMEPLKWNRQAEKEGKQHLVFCASMADVFEQHPTAAQERPKLWALIQETPHLTWQLLTKRPHMINKMVPPIWLSHWPDNVWIGTSVENQQWAEKRIPHLVQVPARVRFLSVEPLLGPVELANGLYRPWIEDVQWVIVGAESGKDARPMEEAWVEYIREECDLWNVPFFFKQRAINGRKQEHPLLYGRTWEQFPE